MRPVRLTMAAFGPFVGIEEIHFEELGKNPLFLINGPTGSGKTTILDGICFALYGKTTGDEREASQMRCDIAAPEQLTYVDLLFQLSGQNWRIRREPEQQRPKGRGEGFTTHQPRAELMCLASDGTESVVATKLTEVKDTIEAMLGLTVEQFRQVMVLPQGEFRKLLVAKSSERERVFSRLFQTQVYNRIEGSLKEQAAAVRRKLEAGRNQQLGILESVEFERESELEQALALKQQLHLSLDQRRKAAEASKVKAERARLLAEKEMGEFERLGLERERLQALKVEQPRIERLRHRLEDARRAARIEPVFERSRQSDRRVRQSLEKLSATQKALEEARKIRNARQDELDSIMAESNEMEEQEEHTRVLKGYLERLGGLEAAYAEQGRLKPKMNQQAGALEKMRQALKQGEQSLEQLEAAMRRGEQKLGRRGELQLAVQQKQLQLDAVKTLSLLHRERDSKTTVLNQKKADRTVLENELEQVRTSLDRVEYAWHAGQAALLAKKLLPDQACPVCGSLEHPAPAQAGIDVPTPEQRERAGKEVERVRTCLATLDSELIRTESELNSQLTQIAAHQQQHGSALGIPQATLEKELASAREVLRDSEAEAAGIQRLQAKHAKTVTELKNDQARFSSMEASLRDTEVQLERIHGELLQLERAIPEPWRRRNALQGEIQTSTIRVQNWKKASEMVQRALEQADLAMSRAERDLVNARENNDSLKKEAERARQDWQAQLQASRFNDLAAFEQSLVEAQQIHGMQSDLERFTRDFERARGAVTMLEKALADRDPPELDDIRAAAQRGHDIWAELQSEYEQVDRQLNSLVNAHEKLSRLKRRSFELEKQYALVGMLADTAAGKTGSRLNLQRFVLSVMLDDVLIVASERLKRMSKGRYTLYRQTEKGRGSAASGLDLLVEDAYYGTQRPVVTLSGGESFMAALSLALALSDVVQSRSGGIRLDTLFIDEGFGSLDSEALELAVRSLIELQSSGRMVGVISHVPELKEWIGLRLDVVTARAGSTTRTVVV